MLNPSKTEVVMKNTLVILDSNGNWMVDWQHTPEAAKIRSLFNSTVLPTPFTTLVAVSEVIATVRFKNPQYKVVAAADNGLRSAVRQ
jgi:hypothetical protein